MGLTLVCNRTNIDLVCMGLTLGLTGITHPHTNSFLYLDLDIYGTNSGLP